MNLTEYCKTLAAAAAEAGAWTERNAALVRNEQEGLLKELRRAGRIFRRCARAAGRKMCAGVFGPSQAGKSYLISALARDAEGSLLARFGSGTHDFISEINPEGGKESTGLVTRFTMTRPASLPDGHPVQIRLLTETDLVKIIANTYYADCEHKEDPQSDIDATLTLLEQRAGAGAAHVDLDALEDLREYLLKDFRAKARVQELERSYWTRALALGPKLGTDDRVLLYGLIWDEVEEFTDLLRQLLRALEALGHAAAAFRPRDALIPRDGSIIDVATLAGLDGGPQDGMLDVATPAGLSAALPRAVVTALTAELTIVMEQKPDEYFDHTDLLDFPGYRSRYKFDDVRRELKKDGLRKEMFLRGKVAYLFQRYCAERELTSMLLCIGPSNQEVQDLPGVINDWVCSTHGERPEARAGRQESLFFVLTKFDMEFEQKKGAPSVETRWDNRLHASLLDFFGKQHDWPHEWDGQHAFNNLFLLRNPNFRFDAVLEYDEHGREKGIRPEMLRYVGELETAFMKSPVVAAHFKSPRAAWDAAMRLNDGGITRIRESLRPLCDPAIKQAQIMQGLDEVRTRLAARLRTFYQTDDREEARRQKLLLIRTLYTLLGQLEKRQQRLGLLLHSFTIRDTDIVEMHPEAERRFRALPEEAACPPDPLPEQQEIDLDNINLDDWNPFAESAAPQERTPQPAVRDEAAFFAEYVESRWVDALHALAEDPAMQKFFMLPEREFSALVSELATGAARLELRAAMTDAFRRASRYANTRREGIVWQQASMAASILNSYVDWLGRNPRTQDEAARTVQAGGSRSVLFTPPPPVRGFPKLQEARTSYTGAWFGDWLKALYALIMDNVNFDGTQTINIEENMLLGGILKRLDARNTESA